MEVLFIQYKNPLINKQDTGKVRTLKLLPEGVCGHGWVTPVTLPLLCVVHLIFGCKCACLRVDECVRHLDNTTAEYM